MENHLIDPMDFGILLKAIGAMAFIVATTGILVGWIMFCEHMIKNPILQVIIVPLPVLVFNVIVFYYAFQQS